MKSQIRFFDPMASLDQKIVPAILDMIRSRRKVRAGSREELPLRSSVDAVPARLREASFSDFQAIADLKRRANMALDSPENWERLWRQNPALRHTGSERPERSIGWVVEAGKTVVGYIGNISRVYRYGDRTLSAVTGHSLVIEPQYRAFGMSLVSAFYRQKGVDLFLTTTAIPEVGRLSKAFKADVLPQRDYETVLFWVLQAHSFAEVVTEKMGLGPLLAGLGSISASFAIAIDTFFRRRWPRGSSTTFTVSEMDVRSIGDEFQLFWNHKRNEKTQLFADRTPEILRWHFEVPGDRGSARVFGCRRNGELVGYAVLRIDPQPDGRIKALVADVVAREDDPDVLKTLFVAAYKYAKRQGSYIFEVVGLPPAVRRVALLWNPYSRKYPACPFYYKAADPALHQELSNGVAWYASPFDGDTTLIRPSFSVPLPPLAAVDESAMNVVMSNPSDGARSNTDLTHIDTLYKSTEKELAKNANSRD